MYRAPSRYRLDTGPRTDHTPPTTVVGGCVRKSRPGPAFNQGGAKRKKSPLRTIGIDTRFCWKDSLPAMNQSVYIILCLVPHGGISVEGVSFDEADAVSRCRSLQMEDMGGYYDYAVEKWTDDGTKGERIIYLEGNGA